MTTENSNLSEIKQTLIDIQKEYYPNISADIIEDIVNVQFENQESDLRPTAKTETQRIIKDYINSIV